MNRITLAITEYVASGQPAAAGREEAATVVAFDRGACDGKLMYQAVEWYFPQHGQSFQPGRYEDVCTGSYVPAPWGSCIMGRVPLFEFEGHSPTISPSAWIAPTATLVGDVRVEADASVWYGAVLRADFGPIVIRAGANVQDGSVLHGGDDPVTEVGEGATIGHLCVVHGAIIGAEALIGNGATVLDGARVGARALVAAGATVPPGLTIPDGMLAVGVPARVAGEVRGGARTWVDTNPQIYRDLARRHAAGVRPVSGP